jgi:hypothetical protein
MEKRRQRDQTFLFGLVCTLLGIFLALPYAFTGDLNYLYLAFGIVLGPILFNLIKRFV